MSIVPLMAVISGLVAVGQEKVWFVDGFHGGVYGHYPMSYTGFMTDRLEKHPDWKISLEIEPETWDTVKVRTPEDYRRFAEMTKTDRIEFTNPAYAQAYFYNVSGESIIRHMYYGMKKIRSHFPWAEFKTYAVEEPCFTSCLPQILRQFGYERASLKCPDTCWGGYTSAFGGEMVNWTGPDGTSIPAVPRHGCEDLVPGTVWQTMSYDNSTEYLNACRQAGFRNPVGMCYQDAGWTFGPWIGDPAKNNSVYTTWKEYFGHVLDGQPEQPEQDWHFTQEDVLVSLMWGTQVMQKIGRQVRRTENNIVRTEKLGAMASIYANVNGRNWRYDMEEMDEAWRTLMLAQHHDSWIVPYNNLNADWTWADNIALWTSASDDICRNIESEIKDSYSGRLEGMDEYVGVCGTGKAGRKEKDAVDGNGRFYVRVFNASGFGRRETVSADICAPFSGGMFPAQGYTSATSSVCCGTGAYSVTDPEGHEVDSWYEPESGKLSFMADVPAFGYATYEVVKRRGGKADRKKQMYRVEESRHVSGDAVNAGAVVAENGMYRIVFDPSRGGVITSLVAKTLGNREYADKESSFSIGEIRGYFYDDSQYHSSADAPAKVNVERPSPFETVVRVSGSIDGTPFVQTVTLRDGDRKIDFSLKIDWKENRGIGSFAQNDAYDNPRRAFYEDFNKLNVMFPVSLAEPCLYKNAPFDVLKSRNEDTFYSSWDKIKHNIILNWVDIADGEDGYGMALFSDHTTSYSFGKDFPLCLTAQFSGNGLWGRDYPITGPSEMNFAIVPHAGLWDKAGICNESICWNEPLYVAVYRNAELENRSWLDLSESGYELSAAYLTDAGLVMRLFNSSGTDGMCTVRLGFGAAQVKEIDLNGNVICSSEFRRNEGGTEVDVQMPRFGIKTLLINGISSEKSPCAERGRGKSGRMKADKMESDDMSAWVKEPAHYVNPFIGACTSADAAGVYHGLGKTFPGAAVPFGMVQVSPNTVTGGDNGSGYSYEMKTIEGFAFTQMSGVGWNGDLGNFLVMPSTGPLVTVAGKEDGSICGYRSRYDKNTEYAEAGYYRTRLVDYDIVTECSALPHCGIMKMTFPESGLSRIQIDLARRVGGTSEYQYVKVLDDRSIAGWMRCTPQTGGWGNGEGNADYTVYFYAEFSRPLTEYGFWSADIPEGWSRKNEDVVSLGYLERVRDAEIIRGQNEIEGRHIGFFTEFPTVRGDEVTLKVGISFVDMEGAKKNFDREIAGKNFGNVRKEAWEMWNRELGRIRIAGGTEDEKTVFYTSMYHSMIDPRIFTDVDGRYTGGDGKIHNTGGKFTKRTIFSGWDVFRSQMPLQTIINPQVNDDLLNSLITLAEQSGRKYFERWELLNAYSGCMLGNPALSVLTDAYIKGIRGYDAEKAYQYAVNTSEKYGNFPLGYTPGGLSISHTLEYAYFDWCLSVLAGELGHDEDAAKLAWQSRAYRNVFDHEKGWFRPRREDGTWEEWPENARLKEWYGCIECNPYQQGWFVPHDIEGMTELMGGREAVIDDLDSLFMNTPPHMLWNEYYNHANEPVHFVPFLYNRLGQPWKTQKWTRFICRNAYFNDVQGLVGNEDAGQMSAWYILAASGLHPSCPGSTRIEVTSPVFSRIEFRLDGKYAKGKKFTVIAHGNSPENIYVRKALLNGRELKDMSIDYSDIMSGGILELYMDSEHGL